MAGCWDDLPGEALEPGQQAGTIEVAGFRWSYVVHVPGGGNGEGAGNRRMPLVLAFHGASGSGSTFLEDTGWAQLADREGVIVVAPDGQPMRPNAMPNPLFNPRLWNSGQFAPDRPRSTVDDLAFFDALIEQVSQTWPVDRNRIFVVGHSNGGAMALRLAAERPEVFSAAASVAGLRYVEPPPGSRAVPILAIFGGADPILPTEGGLSILPWQVRRTPEILPELKRWARSLGCPRRAIQFEHSGPIHRYEFAPGRNGATLTCLLIDRHGHAWPGGRSRPAEPLLIGPRNDAINATELIWDFFNEVSQAG